MKRLALATALLLVLFEANAQPAKLSFRLNWTASGEHAPFFVARDKGFYAQEGLEVEIMDGSGSTTTLQLAANAKNPIGYADAASVMRGIASGMPVKAVGVPLQQSPHAFIYRADKPRPTKISEIKGSRIAVTAGDSSLPVLTALLGKVGLKMEDIQLITVSNTAAKDQAMLSGQADALMGFFIDQGVRLEPATGVKVGWTRLADMAGVSTLSSAIVVNTDWVKDAANQDQLRRFLRASQRGWQYAADNLSESAEIFSRAKPGIPAAVARGTLQGAVAISRTERTKGRPAIWSATEDWADTQALLVQYANLKGQGDVNAYFTNTYLSEAPYRK